MKLLYGSIVAVALWAVVIKPAWQNYEINGIAHRAEKYGVSVRDFKDWVDANGEYPTKDFGIEETCKEIKQLIKEQRSDFAGRVAYEEGVAFVRQWNKEHPNLPLPLDDAHTWHHLYP